MQDFLGSSYNIWEVCPSSGGGEDPRPLLAWWGRAGSELLVIGSPAQSWGSQAGTKQRLENASAPRHCHYQPSRMMLMARSCGICWHFAYDSWMACDLSGYLSCHFPAPWKHGLNFHPFRLISAFLLCGSKKTCLCCLVFNYRRTRELFM